MIQQKVYLIILNLMMVMKSKQKQKDATRKHNAWKRRNKKPRTKQERLAAGETFVTSEKGNSMTPLIMSGQNMS